METLKKCKLCGELVDDFYGLIECENHLAEKHNIEYRLYSADDKNIDVEIRSYFESEDL